LLLPVRRRQGEVQLPSYSTLNGGDLIDSRMQSRMIHGVSTSSYEHVAEEYADRFGISKSSVSRAFVKSSQIDLDLINGQDLSAMSISP
jgi:putative transposase